MRLGFMGRSIRPRATGVGRFAANLLDALADRTPRGAVAAFLTTDGPRYGGRVREVRAPLPTPTEYARALWEQTLVPAQATALGLEVYHSPNYILPFALPCAAVVTIHDISYLAARLHRLRSHLYLSVLTWFALKRAQAIVTVSEHTRRLLQTRYPFTAGRVEVIPEAVDPHLTRPDPDDVARFRQDFGLTEPYVLYVGTLEPRKNLAALVGAYETMAAQAGLPHHLVLVGPRGWKIGALDAAIERSPLYDRIHRLGYVSDADLASCYVGADLFVYPSVAEGFGLPPLEAMAMGTPVVTSSTTSLPEVVGDAALTVNPRDRGALATAMTDVLTDSALAERLRCAGPQRAAAFSWPEIADRYIDVYERATHKGSL
jgi:glycosyltransferase involved in cell wall biosynthesis